MSNGAMLEELRGILQENKKLSAAAATRLTLSALSELIESRKKDKDELAKLLDDIKIELAKIADNPMVRIGFFINKHPKLSGSLTVALLAVLVLPHLAESLLWAEAIIKTLIATP